MLAGSLTSTHRSLSLTPRDGCSLEHVDRPPSQYAGAPEPASSSAPGACGPCIGGRTDIPVPRRRSNQAHTVDSEARTFRCGAVARGASPVREFSKYAGSSRPSPSGTVHTYHNVIMPHLTHAFCSRGTHGANTQPRHPSLNKSPT